MKRFINSNDAYAASDNNLNIKIDYYYDNISKDRAVKKMKRAISKAISNGDKCCDVVIWITPSLARREAIIKYFSGLGYEISSSNGIYSIRFKQTTDNNSIYTRLRTIKNS